MDWEALREEFPITRNFNFQNHAAAAPISLRAVQGAQRYLEHASQNSYIGGGFFPEVDRIRGLYATMLGANADEIAFVKNTSEGLSFVANGLSWQHGDNVVTTNAEFPANIYPWLALKPRGVELRMVLEEDGRIPVERLFEAIDSRTRVVTVSSVNFASGYRHDLATIGEYCQSKGVFLCVDAIQSLGALPIDVKQMQIDFLAADGHKWLCGPEGAGVFYVRKELQGHLRPSTVGWLSVKNAWDFASFEFEFADSACRYESGSHNLPGVYALGGCAELALEIGIDRIASRILHLTERLAEGIRNKGYRLVSSRDRAEASGIVAFTSDVHDQEKLQKHLQAEHRIVIAVRNGRLRASPFAYNTDAEIDQLIDALPKH
jgi:cysteine desulfurase/selenocysteine lyase